MAESGKNISVINTLHNAPGVVFGDVWYHPNGSCGPRIQQDYQLLIVHLGDARISINKEICIVPPGSVALLLPGAA